MGSVRTARLALTAALVLLGALLLLLDTPWNVAGGPGLAPPPDRPFSNTVSIGLFWAAAVNLVLCAAALATAHWWARPLHQRPAGRPPPRPARSFWIALLVAAALGGVLRWPLAHGSFWWDEGWSLTRVVRGL